MRYASAVWSLVAVLSLVACRPSLASDGQRLAQADGHGGSIGGTITSSKPSAPSPRPVKRRPPIVAAPRVPPRTVVRQAPPPEQAMICKTLSGERVDCASPAIRNARLDYIPGCTGPLTAGKVVRFGQNAFTCSGRQR